MTQTRTWRRPAALLVLLGTSVVMVGFAGAAGAWAGGEHEWTPPSSGPSSSWTPSSSVPSSSGPSPSTPPSSGAPTTTVAVTTTTEAPAATTTQAPATTTTVPVGVSPEELVRPETGETGESPEVKQLAAEVPLAATGGNAGLPLGIGLIVVGLGAVILGVRRRLED